MFSLFFIPFAITLTGFDNTGRCFCCVYVSL